MSLYLEVSGQHTFNHHVWTETHSLSTHSTLTVLILIHAPGCYSQRGGDPEQSQLFCELFHPEDSRGLTGVQSDQHWLEKRAHASRDVIVALFFHSMSMFGFVFEQKNAWSPYKVLRKSEHFEAASGGRLERPLGNQYPSLLWSPWERHKHHSGGAEPLYHHPLRQVVTHHTSHYDERSLQKNVMKNTSLVSTEQQNIYCLSFTWTKSSGEVWETVSKRDGLCQSAYTR